MANTTAIESMWLYIDSMLCSAGPTWVIALQDSPSVIATKVSIMKGRQWVGVSFNIWRTVLLTSTTLWYCKIPSAIMWGVFYLFLFFFQRSLAVVRCWVMGYGVNLCHTGSPKSCTHSKCQSVCQATWLVADNSTPVSDGDENKCKSVAYSKPHTNPNPQIWISITNI